MLNNLSTNGTNHEHKTYRDHFANGVAGLR